MKRYYAYIRVSTTRQGEQGSSLQQQRAAIENYAQRFGLNIEAWFEEQETAATRGRRLFSQMLSGLNGGKAHGVIIHKIDRSARNLRDWADLGEMIDRGIEVHFADESLDLTSRGGRLSADIQAVVASDYIRNLREEVRKGFYGRLKQGFYPLPAPIGYRNEGGGKAKSIDPATGPFVRLAFELYGSGRFSLDTLGDELYRRGLRNNNGGRVSRNGLSEMLNNQFYIGIIRIRRTGECFQGVHEPLVAASLFHRVQNVLVGRTKIRGLKHDFRYRKTLRCDQCERRLVGETRKGHVYYRCHAQTCKGVCVREELIEHGMKKALQELVLSEQELVELRNEFKRHAESATVSKAMEQDALRLKLAKLDARMERLTDAFIDRLIEKNVFEERKSGLLKERAFVQEALAGIAAGRDGIAARLEKLFELLTSLQNMEILGNPLEQRDMAKNLSSDLRVRAKNLLVTWHSPFDLLAFRHNSAYGGAYRDTGRTLKTYSPIGSSSHPNANNLFCNVLEAVEKEPFALI